MRVLFISRSTKFDGTSSLANIPKLVIHRMLLEDPTLDVTWLVPRAADDQQVHRFMVAPLPEQAQSRIRFVKATGHGFDRMVGYFSTEEIWAELNQARTKHPYDLVVSQQAPMLPAYKALLMNRMMSSRYSVTTPWVLWHLWTATLSQMEEVPEYYMGEADVAAELMGCYHADLNLWESNYLLQDALQSMRKWFQPATVKKVIDNSEPVHSGVEITRLDEVYERRMARLEEDPQRRLLWSARYANQKKPRLSFSQIRRVQTELAVSGTKVDVVICSSQPTPEWAELEYHDWKLYESQDRDGWLNVLSQGDLVLCNAVSESYGATWLEMLGAGAIVVFERAWWNEQLLPDWYPFIVDTKDDQVRVAKLLLSPDGERLWEEYVPRIREWIRSEHSDLASGPKMLSYLGAEFDRAVKDDAGIGSGTIGQLAHKAALATLEEAEGDVIGLDEVFAVMKNTSDSERDWGKIGDPISRMYLRRALQANGWVDVGGETVALKREDVVS